MREDEELAHHQMSQCSWLPRVPKVIRPRAAARTMPSNQKCGEGRCWVVRVIEREAYCRVIGDSCDAIRGRGAVSAGRLNPSASMPLPPLPAVAIAIRCELGAVLGR
jgi:hypothetical protein